MTTNKIAVFVDYDNQQLDVFALIEMLRERGRVVIRRAYADWVTRQSYRKTVVQAGFELIDCPKISATHKNAADIRLAVDCLSIGYDHEDIETFVLVTGDVDFVPLINKLRTMGRDTIVVAANASAAELLLQSCDEYIPAYRLDEIETHSTEQLSFEESLELLKKAYEYLKTRSSDLQGKDIKSLLKNRILQLNPSFDEKDYEDCSSFTSYLEKARMFVKLDGIFTEKTPARGEPSESKESQAVIFPETLLIKVFNEILRRWGPPVTFAKFEKMLFGIHPGISLKLYGVKNAKHVINAFKEQGLLITDGTHIDIKPDTRFKLGLKQLKFFHKPETRKIIISKIIALAKSWDSEKKDLTLSELKKSMIEEGENAIARSDFDGVINTLKTGGAFLSPDNIPISSLNIPLHLVSYRLADLEDEVLRTSIYRLLLLSSIENNEQELKALSELLLGKNDSKKITEIKKIFQELETAKKITRKNNSWVKYRK